ncbi:pinoresinol reductase 2 [Colletotrichum spaethianum]|uniref:Pinoresinol reductase 2 n=1 Tax=Colletotrichum spaethianum TaxID=700344 RepID=A0AA37P8I4_9PEZI|nr:pinoresinol reductase 2 [Colletotrichum spaethianum]GKT47604.1 pinoresinol reductase 2 [Colletotrichum spaethianum]
MSVKKVTVVGGSGNLGPSIIGGLLAGGFEVTALSRKESSASFPSEVTVKKVDINSVEEVTEALKGQDAVVSIVGTAGFASQKALADAAVAAKVKRFIPSEFGINTREARGTKIGGILTPKIQTVDYLIELSEKNSSFTWTGIAVGPFFDWGFSGGLLGFDVKNKTVNIFDSGNEPISPSTLGFIGKSVAGVLKNLEATTNKYIDVASFTTTQRELLKVIEQETGSAFTVNNVKTSDLEKTADEKLAKGDFSAFIQLLQQHIFGDGNGNVTKDNAAVKLLGLQEEDVKAETKKAVAAWK